MSNETFTLSEYLVGRDMAKKYYFIDPDKPGAHWACYGEQLGDVVTQARKAAKRVGRMVPVSYEDINACGTVRETGDVVICFANGKTHWTGQ